MIRYLVMQKNKISSFDSVIYKLFYIFNDSYIRFTALISQSAPEQVERVRVSAWSRKRNGPGG